MSNIIDKIQVSGVTYDIGGSGGGGNPTVELTQAEYDALVTAGTVSADTYYIITDAQAGDLTNYYTKTETNTLLAGKQATLVSGTNIKTINNTSILGSGNIDIQGGGKAIEAGRGIEITTGATADTVSVSLPITAGTGGNSILINEGSVASGSKSIAGGQWCQATKEGSIALGQMSKANASWAVSLGNNSIASNISEFASGTYNVSNGGSTTADKTLFSVGNGTSPNARHNAFEIRQNGDIYCSDGTNDVKLQDTITATAANTTALGGLKLVKLSQTEYDSLSTKDNSTLYVIVN